jgi:hypothetical protein
MFFRSRNQEPPAMTLEGVLGPNSRLDEAESFGVDAPQALCVASRGQLLFSSGNTVHALAKWGGKPKKRVAFDRPVTALAASPGGLVAVGLEGGDVVVLDGAGKRA